MKEFDVNELAQYNGENGKPIYIAYRGKVYDVSSSRLWRRGLHMKRHRAGQDLTTDVQAAPHEADVLDKFPQVGILKKEVVEVEIPAVLDRLLRRYPVLQRHPHPSTVHFPIVFVLSTTFFNILYLITGETSFETTAFHCLGGGILFTVVAIFTGFFTWWLNYKARPLKQVKIKIPLSLIMFIIEIILFVWRIKVPDVLHSLQGVSIIYFLMVLSLAPMVAIIAWNGATMTFPREEE